MTFKYINVNVISIIPKNIDIPIYRKFQYRIIGIYKKTIIISVSIYRNSLAPGTTIFTFLNLNIFLCCDTWIMSCMLYSCLHALTAETYGKQLTRNLAPPPPPPLYTVSALPQTKTCSTATPRLIFRKGCAPSSTALLLVF
jgi:hypothetical protein